MGISKCYNSGPFLESWLLHIYTPGAGHQGLRRSAWVLWGTDEDTRPWGGRKRFTDQGMPNGTLEGESDMGEEG